MVSFCREIFLLCRAATVLTFFIAVSFISCALSTSITWERTPHPVRRPAFSYHLVSSVILHAVYLESFRGSRNGRFVVRPRLRSSHKSKSPEMSLACGLALGYRYVVQFSSHNGRGARHYRDPWICPRLALCCVPFERLHFTILLNCY